MGKRFWMRAALLPLGMTLAGVAGADHDWNDYHWARTTPAFMLKVIDSTTAAWDAELRNALTAWSAADALELAVAGADSADRTRKRCAMVAGQMRVCNAAYGNNGWLGLATIGIDAAGHIDRGTAKVNDSYASYWALAGEKNHVMCQEIGHVFGLGHTSEDGSSQGTCMDYSSDLGSQWPNAHDYEQLAAAYAHLDPYDSYDDGSAPACTGRRCPKARALPDVAPRGVRVHRRGHAEIWVASRPDGGLWIHHVRLAPGHGTDDHEGHHH